VASLAAERVKGECLVLNFPGEVAHSERDIDTRLSTQNALIGVARARFRSVGSSGMIMKFGDHNVLGIPVAKVVNTASSAVGTTRHWQTDANGTTRIAFNGFRLKPSLRTTPPIALGLNHRS